MHFSCRCKNLPQQSAAATVFIALTTSSADPRDTGRWGSSLSPTPLLATTMASSSTYYNTEEGRARGAVRIHGLFSALGRSHHLTGWSWRRRRGRRRTAPPPSGAATAAGTRPTRRRSSSRSWSSASWGAARPPSSRDTCTSSSASTTAPPSESISRSR